MKTKILFSSALAFTIILLITFSLGTLAQTKQELPSGFLYNISPLTVDQETGKMDYVFSGILLAFDAANAADFIFTKRALASGLFYENNPIMRGALRHEPLDLVLKIGATAASSYLLKMAYHEDKTGAYIAAILLSSGYSWVTYHNYRIMIQCGM